MVPRFYLAALIVCFSCLTQAAQDKSDPYDAYRNSSDYDESLEIPWLEREVMIDRLPQDADLTRLAMDNMPINMSLYADLANLTVGAEDRITRLWLVARSRQGAYNGTYEGIRCATGEYKVYAYANPKRQQPLRKVPLARWRPVQPTGYRRELMRDYLCNDTLPRLPNEVMNQLDKNPAGYESSY